MLYEPTTVELRTSTEQDNSHNVMTFVWMILDDFSTITLAITLRRVSIEIWTIVSKYKTCRTYGL